MILNSLKNAMFAALGAQEMVMELVDKLVQRGQLSEAQGVKLVKEWTDKINQTGTDISLNLVDVVHKTLERMSLPTKEDVDALAKKVNFLTARVGELEDIIQRLTAKDTKDV
ncbi:MAG: hypothetical protein HQL05_01895 [Nitrospirae bacterium]|uniref:phasin family protein n=1 Tax=Candidatus Magnetobacterium casense TaxID=1455061 RepID=UPI00058AE20A|nr:hypothetical protein [Candidatus Magnetobacterium casensis]MBF0336562.1 hypothetical protein [Nitrospirota bacterium]